MNTRVYNDKIKIDEESAKEFWNKRADNHLSLKSVFLGADLKPGSDIIRNNKETEIINSHIDIEKLSVLDIGCGIGRWAENLHDRIESYTGIDYSKKFIDYANKQYADNKNINFIEMSACDINESIISTNYNLILCTGVLMYINDDDISKVFNAFKRISPEYIYIQESISLMDVRLTLNNFESKELKTNYSAIYRTQEEYEKYFKELNFDIIKTGLLLDNEIGARKETNARYWIVKIG